MSIVFTDTETSGLIPKFASYTDLRVMPHLIQLAAIRTDDEGGNEEKRIDLIIRPDNYLIPKESSDIHGITHERAMDEGIDLREAMEEYHSMLKGGATLACYNVAFDSKILAASFRRAGATSEHVFKPGRRHLCVMLAATPVVNLPSNNPRYNNPAWPKLFVAVEKLLGRPMRDGAHNALVDIEETIEVFKFLKSKGHIW